MRESPYVRFTFYKHEHVMEWRKSQTEWLIVEDGRYGPKWLTKLIFRAAKHFGMIRHERLQRDLGTKTITVDRAAKTDLFEEMRAACLHSFQHYGLESGRIKIICGELEMQELIGLSGRNHHVSFDLIGPWCEQRGAVIFRVDGVPLHVIPGLRGWTIVPAEV